MHPVAEAILDVELLSRFNASRCNNPKFLFVDDEHAVLLVLVGCFVNSSAGATVHQKCVFIVVSSIHCIGQVGSLLIRWVHDWLACASLLYSILT
jgi:hypothetical protein